MKDIIPFTKDNLPVIRMMEAYVTENPYCECHFPSQRKYDHCSQKTTSIHFSKGKEKNLTNVSSWMAVCTRCDSILNNPKHAKLAVKYGYTDPAHVVYPKNKVISASKAALKDISNHIKEMVQPFLWKREEYVNPKHLNTKETRNLNRELGVHKLNMKNK